MTSTKSQKSPLRRLLRGGKRVGWGIADQVFSSATNFLLGVLVARSVSIRDFGIFALIFTAYTFSLGASRAIIGEPLCVRFVATTRERWRIGVGAGAGTALVVGALIGVACAGVALFFEGTTQRALFAFGLGMPVLVLQDTWRYCFFAARRAHLAFVNDLIWFLAMVPGFALVTLNGWDSMPVLILAWSGSALVAATAGVVQTRAWPRVLETRAWWRAQRDLASGFFGDFIVRNSMQRLSVYAVAAIAGLEATASIRGADIILGPATVLLLGIPPLMVPEAVRLLHSAPRRVYSSMIRLSAFLSAFALAVGVVIVVLPSRVGEALLGNSWEGAHRVVPFMTLALAMSAANTGALTGLRALGESKRLFKSRLVASSLITIGVVAGATIAGAIGAPTGNAAGTLIANFIWWRQLKKALRERDDRKEGVTASELRTMTVE